MKHIPLKRISLKNHPQLNEKWLQNVIAEAPSILGLGEVILKDRERMQTGAGRLDLLFQEADGYGRYEVEIQLGPTNESHIIRTLEYWDIERRRYPQYEHTAVIVAEEITSRFLNVISLFNGFIPLMAIQVRVVETQDGASLFFTKVLDTVQLGLLNEDEETTETVDRNYWEQKGTRKTVQMADRVFEVAKEFAPALTQSYNKYYIGFWLDGKAFNFATCRPQKDSMQLRIRLPRDEATDEKITENEVDVLEYDKRGGQYRLKLKQSEIEKKRDLIRDLLKAAYDRRNGF